MLWFDSVYPPPVRLDRVRKRGPCAQGSGNPSDVETKYADSGVSFMNIKFGEVGSTVGAPSLVPPSLSPTPVPTPSSECCSWGGGYCGDISDDYCKANAGQCADCGGT